MEQTEKAGLKLKLEAGIKIWDGEYDIRRKTEIAKKKGSGVGHPVRKALIDVRAYMFVIKPGDITESAKTCCTHVPAKILSSLVLEKAMFEAADSPVFSWYVKNNGSRINLFVDHNHDVQFECLRSGNWETADTWEGSSTTSSSERRGALRRILKEVYDECHRNINYVQGSVA